MDDGGLPLANLRANVSTGSPTVTYTNSESDSDIYGSLVRFMSEERPQPEGIYLADNSGANSAVVADAFAKLRKGPSLGEAFNKEGSFLYGLKEGRANRSVMDTRPVSFSEKLGAWTRDLVVGAKDSVLEVPLMVADTAQLGYLTVKAAATGRADEFSPWSDTGKFAKAGGTLSEYYASPFVAIGEFAGNVASGELDAASSGAATLLGGIVSGRGSNLIRSSILSSAGVNVCLYGRFGSAEQLGSEAFFRYQRYTNEAYAATLSAEARGRLIIPEGISRETIIGQRTDAIARSRMDRWLSSEGISEGPGQTVQLNRWMRDPSGNGSYRIPDIRIPDARLIMDGTIGYKWQNTPQVADFHTFSGGSRIIIVRPAGRAWRILQPVATTMNEVLNVLG